MRNTALVVKWLWQFSLEASTLWHKVNKSKYGLHPNGWDANSTVKVFHARPWKFISQGYNSFRSLLSSL